MSRNIKLLIAYDGTSFVGWQRQSNGSSVQGLIEKALTHITQEPISLMSSGRTDAGVHAREMVAHFHTQCKFRLAAFREGVNNLLPRQVVIIDAEDVPLDFHARYSAVGKWYRYSYDRGDVRSPFIDKYAWRGKRALDFELMESCAKKFKGVHDFRAFRAASCNAKTTMREMFATKLSCNERQIHFDVCGSGFLQNMVRVIAGTIHEVGAGIRDIENVDGLFSSTDRRDAGVTAPAAGLMLMKVWYNTEELRTELLKW